MISGRTPGEYEEIQVDPGNRILPDSMMLTKHNYLYVLSRSKVCSVFLLPDSWLS